MSNPVLDRVESITRKEARTPAGYPTMPGYEPGVGNANERDVAYMSQNTATMPPVVQDSFQTGSAYDAPTDSVLTYDDVLVKSAMLFGLVLCGAAVAWYFTLADPAMGSMLTTVGAIGGFVLALVNIFKREPSPALVMAYGVMEGLFLGGISAVFNEALPGVVMQALIASLVVFVVTLVAFSTGAVRNTPKLQMIGLVGIIGLVVLQLLNWILSAFGAVSGPWGFEGGSIMGIPVAALLGIVVIVLGAISFVGDFDQIRTAVNRQIPQKYSWSLAFGLMVTLIWLYVNLLRYAAILSSRD